jgi:F-type H+-transporting ATPase subunit epsilon
MRLLITDPVAVVADHDDIESLRAEDESGSVGILPGHEDLLTVLAVTVLSWQHRNGRRSYCAVRRGVLTVQGGSEIAVATREARCGDDPATLEQQVLVRFLEDAEAERSGKAAAVRLHTQAVRRIIEALRDNGPRVGIA